MKRKRLLFSFVGVLFGMLSAGAATWNSPTLKFTNFTAGDTLYFSSVETSKFLGAQNNKPQIATDGIMIVPVLNSDGSYYLKCSTNGKDFTYMYIPDANSLSIAGADTTKHNSFTVDVSEDGSFKFRANKDDVEYGDNVYVDFFCGVYDITTNTTMTPLVMVDLTVSNALTWKAVSKAEYIDFSAKNNLSLAMDKAQNYGMDIAAALAVYNNAASTNDQFVEETNRLKELIYAYEIEHATEQAPVDFTDKIVNATCADLSGWTNVPASAFGNGSAKTYNWCGGGNDGALETWQSSGNLSNRSLTQSLSSLPNGKYIVGGYICAAQQGNSPEVEDAQRGVYLYASASGLEARTNASTTGYNAKYYEANAYVSDGTLTLGVVAESCNSNWICVDNFTLKYCGTGTVVSDMKDKIKALVDSAAIVLANGEMNQTYVDDLTSKKTEAETLIGNSSATFQNTSDMYHAMTKSVTEASTNQAAYIQLKATFDNANYVLGSLTLPTVQLSNLSDYLSENDIEEMMANKPYTTDQISAIITTLNKLITSATNSQLEPGTDVTYLVKDAGFDGDHTVWGDSLSDFEKSLAVKWCKGLLMTQTFEDVPAGTYKLQVQAFDRPIIWGKDEAYEYDQWMADSVSRANAVGLTIFMNSDEKKVKNWFAEGDKGMTAGYQTPGGWYAPPVNPWNQGGTATIRTFFDAGLFDNELTTVVTDGTLTIGIKSGFLCWGAFDNVRLTYVGPNREDGVNLLQGKLDAANTALASKMNGDLKKQLEALADSSAETLNDENSAFSKMIVLSSKIANLMPSVNSSISHYKTLFNVDSIVGVSVAKSEIAATEAGAKLKSVYDESSTVYAMDYPTYVDADIDSLSILMGQELLDAQAKAYIKEPGDVTVALLNPSFDFSNSFGWMNAYPSVTFKVAEVYNNTFNLYQTLHNVPNGKYTLKAQAFFRPLTIADAVSHYNGATPDAVKSFLYANNDSVAVKHIASEPSKTKLFDNGDWQTDYGYVVGSDSAYVPASMHGTSLYFAQGKYENEVSTIVTDNTLKIGIKMPNATGNSDYWTIFDNFRLILLDPSGVENTLNNTVKTVSTKVYDANGMQKSKLSKGLNIVKKVMSDGTTVVEKTIIK
jgi:hypothetical protein